MSVVASENNDVMLFREVNCKMLLFAMKYAIRPLSIGTLQRNVAQITH
jgi:hypothetical protein